MDAEPCLFEASQKADVTRAEIADSRRSATATARVALLLITLLMWTTGYAEIGITEDVTDLSGKGRVFNSAGGIYTDAYGYEALATDSSLADYIVAADAARRGPNRRAETYAVNNLGIAYSSYGRYEQAIEAFERALTLAREAEDSASSSAILNNLALTYASLSRQDKAAEYFEQALAAERESPVGGPGGQGVILNNLAGVYRAQQQYDKAVAAYQEALRLLTAGGHGEGRQGEEILLNNLAGVYKALGDTERAVETLEEALQAARKINNRVSEAKILHNLGAAYDSRDRFDEAINAYHSSLTLKREVKDRAGEAATLNNLMFAWKARGKYQLAIFYGKQAINTYQAIRADIQRLDKETQNSYLASNEDSYRVLADALIAEGRLPEAQQVLNLLKSEEYFGFVRGNQDEAPSASARADLTPTESDWQQRYNEIADSVTKLGVERSELLAKTPRSAAEDQRLTQLDGDLIVANRAFHSFLDGLAGELAAAAQPDDKILQVREAQGLMEDLRELGDGTVALYTLVGEQALRIVLITPDVQKAAESRVTAAELNRKVFAFRKVLQDPRLDPKPLARELYALLVGPVARDLEGAQAQTLMWALDGALRYLPVSALHDGSAFLVERYRSVVFTPASNARLKDPPQSNWRGIGLGVSKAQPGFDALPGAAAELREVIRAEEAPDGVVPGVIRLDEAFTADTMTMALRQRYPLVHIASHFSFKPGNDRDSFLLLGDGAHLTLEEIRLLPNAFSGVDLLTLSACDTATGSSGGDGKEVESFGVLAQRQGAKAVLATLWPVADEATRKLMRDFYRLRQSSPRQSKAEALRQAQLMSLRGSAQPPAARDERGVAVADDADIGEAPAQYAHPYFWASFILIGNWL
jgi:CHAT domain-containing protein/tetratricopeptide (TPR) repeat protein